MNNENLERPNYYAIITAEVRYAPNLTANAKLLYAEITALANKSGACWASNKYFAELYNVKERAISDWVRQLEVGGFVVVKITNNTQRRISVNPTLVKIHRGGSENSLVNTKTNIVPKGTSHEVQKQLLDLANKILGREFRVLPERGVKKTLDNFSLVEIELALTAISRDDWHREKIKELKLEYFIRSTTIDKFLAIAKKKNIAPRAAQAPRQEKTSEERVEENRKKDWGF